MRFRLRGSNRSHPSEQELYRWQCDPTDSGAVAAAAAEIMSAPRKRVIVEQPQKKFSLFTVDYSHGSVGCWFSHASKRASPSN